ncbi:MAG: hypothetical protein ACREBS_03940 [Nitrososphaerales archaeon]
MSLPESGIQIADISGFLALVFITATAVLMFAKKRLLGRRPGKQAFVSKIHIGVAVLGGAFLLVHADYFIKAPISNFAILLGYIGTGVAIVVWFTGFSFLERLKYSLLYHGSLSLFAISLMVVHSLNLGFSVPLELSEILLVVTVGVVLARAFQHIIKILSR